MKTPLKILHVEDEPLDTELIQLELEKQGLTIKLQRVETPGEYLAALEKGEVDLILSDYSLPGFDGFSALKIRQQKCPDIPFILISGTLGEEAAIEAFRRGATDYILKHHLERLVPSIHRALREVEEREERHNLEAQLRQAQKMEAIGRLAGGIAHDFNNLLTAIIGFSQLLMNRLEPDSKHRHEVEEIQKAGKIASTLTQQLLAFSRQQPISPKIINLNSIIAERAELLRRLIGANILITFQLDEALAQIKADPGQIEQVIINLAVNARDAMPRGGELRIATSNVELFRDKTILEIVLPPGHYVLLSFSDDGAGISKEIQARLFEPFFTTKESGEGTGLGLATVYGIVRQNGGGIFVESEVNEGATFKLYLPCVTEGETVSSTGS